MKTDDFNKKRALIEEALGYQFRDQELLKRAMTHSSYWNEHKQDVHGHNEKLEFLGDAVLNLIVAHYLYDKLPVLSEGQLTQMRSQIVDASACFSYCENMGISSCLYMGRGELYNPGRGRETIIGDFFEALIGAVYLDGGLQAAQNSFRSHFDFVLEKQQEEPTKNWKSQLQDVAQKHLGATPIYQTLEESGPEHAKRFKESVLVAGEMIGQGEGYSKKEAQMNAAKQGFEALQKKYHES